MNYIKDFAEQPALMLKFIFDKRAYKLTLSPKRSDYLMSQSLIELLLI